MRTIKQKLRKISAWALAAALLGSSFDGSLPAEAAAAGENKNSAVILSFAEISDEIKKQTLEAGEEQSKISLPEELTVALALQAGDSGEDATEASAESETQEAAAEPGTEAEVGAETVVQEEAPTEPETTVTETAESQSETAAVQQTDPVTEATVQQTEAAEAQPDPVTETEAAVQQTEAAEAQPETVAASQPDPVTEAAVQQTEAAQTQPETAAVLQAAPPAETEAPAERQTEGGVLTSLLDRVFPAMTVHAAEEQGTEGQTENVTLTGITWEIDAEKSSAAEFSSDESAIGNIYVYTPVLPETVTLETGGGTMEYYLDLGEGAELPEIAVSIAEKAVSDPVARVEKNGETEEFDDIKKAFESVGNGETAVITLLDDVELGGSGYDSGYIKVTGTVTLEGGAYTISGSHMSYPVMGMIDVRPEAMLTVNGGNYKNTSSQKHGTIVIYVGSGGTLVFNAGTVTAESSYVGNSVGVYGIYVNQNGSAEINGGTISGLAPDGEGAGVCAENGSLTVTGGIISGSLKGAEIAYNLTDTSANISGGTFSGQYGLYVRLGGGTLTGGTFTGSVSAVFCDSEQTETNAVDLLGDGFVYYPGGTAEGTPAVSVDSTDDALPAGTYTVGKCGSHSFGEWASCGDSGHSRVCAYCGTEMTEEHAYADGICTACGAYEPAVWKEENGRYEIGNAGQLFWFAELVNGSGGQEADPGASAVLTADIDLGDRPWTPIGNPGAGFAGVFDGGGHTVSGLSVSSDSNYQGLFGYFCGTVRNLYVTGTVAGSEYVGGIVGFAFDSTIESCSFSGTVVGSSDVGGILGYNTRGKVTGCSFSGEVSGSVGVGGIAGRADGGTVITGCANGGSVNGGGYGSYYAGGIVGDIQRSTVTNCSNTGKVSGGTYVGGITGMSYGSIKGCCSTGEISGNTAAAGIVGYNSGSVTVCYYLDTSAGTGIADDVSSGITVSLTAEEFASGMAAWLLNGGSIAEDGTVTEPEGDVWKQEIGTDSLPVFSGATVYYYERCSGEAGWTNDPGLKKEAHQISEENYCCTVCGAQMVARVTANEETAYYTDITDAFGSVGEGELATVTLLCDVNLETEKNIIISGDVTLEGQSFTLSGSHSTASSGMIIVPENAKLTVRSGNITNTTAGDDAHAYVICVNGGEMIVEGGMLSGVTDSNSPAAGVYAMSGAVEIKSGTISGTNARTGEPAYGMFAASLVTVTVTGGTIKSSCDGLSIGSEDAVLTGGTFIGDYRAISCDTDSAGVGKLLQEGYAYYSGENVAETPSYGVNTTSPTLPAGIYTVGRCENHSYGGWSDAGDGNHTHVCEYCGTGETAAHNWTAWTEDEETGNHIRTCSDCGAEESGEHKWGAWGADSSGNYIRTCENCDATETAAASVSRDGGRMAEYYISIEEAWAAAKELSNGDTQTTLTLLQNVTVSTTLTVESGDDIIFASAAGTNHTLFGDANETNGGLINIAGGTFTLVSGTVKNGENGSNAIAVSGGGKFIMNGGSAVAQADGHSGICVYKGGTAEINGGSASGYNGLAIVDGGSGTVSGGTFTGTYLVADNSAAVLLRNVSGTLQTILEPGMAYYSGTDVIAENLITDLTGTRLYGTVTIGECKHSYGAWTDDGDGKTHSRECVVCSAKVSENHTWDENGRCTVDGCDAQGTIVASVTADGEAAWYTDIDEAWAAANAVDSAEVMLLTSVTCQSVLWVETGSDITLAMQEGVVLSAEKANYVIYVSSSGSFTMKSGSIVTSGPYGIWVPDSGNFTLEDGSIAANGDDSYYGIYARGNIDLKGGNVSGTRDGVYIRINDGVTGSVTIGDTVISGGQYGVQVFSGSVSINGGKISGESASVYVYDGTAYLNGGTIDSADNGVKIHSLGTMKIDGSTINGKTGVNNEGRLSVLSGTITGTEIGLSTEADNTQLSGGTFIGGTYSISCKDNTALAGLLAEYHDCYVGKDDTTVRIEDTVLSGTELSAVDGYGTVTVARNLEYVALVEMGGSETLYSTGEEYETVLDALNAAWSAAAAAGENATVTLLQNINIGTDSLEVPAGSSITLKMADDIALSGSNNEKTGGIIKITGGSFVLAGGTVRNTITYGYGGQGFGIYVESGSLSVEGGEVVGNYAIYLPEGAGEDASVQISGGLIAGYGCGIGIYGGQVSVEGDAEIKATGNSLSFGTFVQGGKLAVNGGLVSGIDIGIWNVGGNVTVSGGTVTGDYGLYMSYGEAEILGGTIRGTGYHGVYAEHGTQEAVKLTIRGGEFDGARSGIYLYERSTEAEVQICIYGGTFYGEYGIYAGVENKRVPELFGGTFTGSVCSVYLKDGTVAGDLPAEGYSLYAVAEDGTQTLIPEEAAAGSSLSAADGYGTVTVKNSNEDVISVEVSWDALEYTYTDGAWNPDTYTYEEGKWTADNGGDSITVKNTGSVDTTVSYLYSPSVTTVSGRFSGDDGNFIDAPVALARGEERKAYLALAGRPSSDFTAGTLGTVTVTIGGEE